MLRLDCGASYGGQHTIRRFQLYELRERCFCSENTHLLTNLLSCSVDISAAWLSVLDGACCMYKKNPE